MISDLDDVAREASSLRNTKATCLKENSFASRDILQPYSWMRVTPENSKDFSFIFDDRIFAIAILRIKAIVTGYPVMGVPGQRKED